MAKAKGSTTKATTKPRTRLLLTAAAALSLLVLQSSAPLPLHSDERKTYIYALLYDLDSTSAITCAVGALSSGPSKIQTSGSSTTVSETTTGSNPFNTLSIGDVLVLRPSSNTTAASDLRYITAKASAASVTVGDAANWTGGWPFSWYKQTCGTGTTNGWQDFSAFDDALLSFTIEQMNATSIQMRVECRADAPGAGINVVYPGESSDCGPDATLASGWCSFAGPAPVTHGAYIKEPEGECRLSMKITSDDVGDTGTDREKISASVSGRIRK